MTYLYQVVATGHIVEIEHPITQPAFTVYDVDGQGQTVEVKRLISAGTGFILKGGCWHRDSYEKGLQSGPKK